VRLLPELQSVLTKNEGERISAGQRSPIFQQGIVSIRTFDEVLQAEMEQEIQTVIDWQLEAMYNKDFSMKMKKMMSTGERPRKLWSLQTTARLDLLAILQ
jgi:hypothetical protein